MKTTMNVKDAFLKWHDRDWTPEEKTFSKKLEEYADEKHSAGFLGGWNAALASVVDEPGLTEADILARIEKWGRDALKPYEGHWEDLAYCIFTNFDATTAGRIPASKPDDQERLKNYEAVLRSIGAPEILCTGEMGQLAELDEADMEWAREQAKKIVPTPQQEGGLTLEHLKTITATLWDADVDTDDIATALLAVLQKELATLRAELANVTELLNDRVSDCESLTQQLADAKKGRYAIGQEVQVYIGGPNKIWLDAKVGVYSPGWALSPDFEVREKA